MWIDVEGAIQKSENSPKIVSLNIKLSLVVSHSKYCHHPLCYVCKTIILHIVHCTLNAVNCIMLSHSESNTPNESKVKENKMKNAKEKRSQEKVHQSTIKACKYKSR